MLWGVVAGILSIITLVLKIYSDEKKKQNDIEAEKSNLQKDNEIFDNALAKRDCDSLSASFDKLRIPEDPNNPAGKNNKKPS